MSKNEIVTKDYLTKQLELEKERLDMCNENLKIHKDILQSLMSKSDNEALK